MLIDGVIGSFIFEIIIYSLLIIVLMLFALLMLFVVLLI